jgi:TRAP-type C4-dicarboxylate transport system permease small subunit
MQGAVTAVLRRLVWLTEAAAAVLIGFIVCCNAAQIFYRYVLLTPLSWTDEAMRYSMVWVAFLAGSALVFRQEHMALTVIDSIRSKAIVWLLRAFVLLAIFAFAILLVIYGWPLAMRNARQLSPSAQIPLVWAYVAVPVGGVLMALYAAWLLIFPKSAPVVEDELESFHP